MKTVIMRDIVGLAATEEQLDELAETLTQSQFYDLMMNIGTDGNSEDIAVLSKNHPGSKDYKDALVKCIGKPKKFWDNANTLVANINKDIAESDRTKFHVIDRVIDPKLIDLLDKGVPSNDEALALVIEDTYDANNVLAGLLNGYYDDSMMAEVKLTLEGKPVQAHIGTQCEFFCGRYQPKNSLIIYLLKKFRDTDRKTVTLTKREIQMYVERERYAGVVELHILESAFYVLFGGEKKKRSMGYPYFSAVTTRRSDNTSGYPSEFPEEITVTINDESWALLTNVACEYGGK